MAPGKPRFAGRCKKALGSSDSSSSLSSLSTMSEEDVVPSGSSGDVGCELPPLPELSPLSDVDFMSGNEDENADEVPVRDGLSLFPSDSLSSSVDAIPPLSPVSFDGEDIFMASGSQVKWPSLDAEMKPPVNFASVLNGLGSQNLFDSRALNFHESKSLDSDSDADLSLASIKKRCPTTPLDSSDGVLTPTVREEESPTALAQNCPDGLPDFMDQFEETLPDTLDTTHDVLDEVKVHFRGKEVGVMFLFLSDQSDHTPLKQGVYIHLSCQALENADRIVSEMGLSTDGTLPMSTWEVEVWFDKRKSL